MMTQNMVNAIFAHIANNDDLRKGFEQMTGNTVEEMQNAYKAKNAKALTFFQKFGRQFMANNPQPCAPCNPCFDGVQRAVNDALGTRIGELLFPATTTAAA